MADAAPIFGWWDAHIGWGTMPAIAIGAFGVAWAPAQARRLPWRHLLVATWATSAAWAVSLALIDGWRRGFVDRLADPNEYLYQVPSITDIPAALRSFVRRIPDFQGDSWVTHVAGHPPGALLTFVWLDRLGLGGGLPAGILVVFAGSSAAAAVVITVRTVHDEVTARRAAPFLALAPTAIWVAVSADGYFMAIAAWGIALLALSIRRSGRPGWVLAASSGLLLGWAVMLSYGLVLASLIALPVVLTAANRATALRRAALAAATAVAVVGIFDLHGFWWVDGYHAVQQRYWQGIAHDRPIQYWSWANLASIICAIGFGSVAGIGQALDASALRRRRGLNLLVVGSLAAIAVADVSLLSKAETERIWLPFALWMTAAPALLPPRSQRWWLAVNVIGALLINHVIFTNW
ncbi:hypothetical protein [Mycolicibacterium sphagni]|uniref:hypothetical protein n=1 Tax=Mycolicibacterium sphagni TaxID=1786 RepID=UPI0031F53703